MSWYKQAQGGAQLQLVAFTSQGSDGESAIQNEFAGHFKSPGMKNYMLNLSLEGAQVGDTGTYFCGRQDYTVKQQLRKPNTQGTQVKRLCRYNATA
ncbi:hypothetical protein JRQ81_013367 [Phrynocephalus forsythii]|uniref:Immunoglobulin V-set domain-containing protein n=1 Tax=Phrynocephalus forsythii TaxID=171643 RepID=A0A9Q0Y0Z0_9SAUR|nr:hypothetical protein JRQ81_013367 [Phrynocephalus forsythii]